MFGDGMLTPAISVMSAIEGVNVLRHIVSLILPISFVIFIFFIYFSIFRYC
jgi:K+ transporter